MKLSKDEVRHVAALARLQLSDGEVDQLADEMGAILGYAEKLGELDTDQVEPTSHVVSMDTPFREDHATREPDPERTLANAPKREGNFFVVPSIIE